MIDFDAPRAVEEWVGRDADTPVPARVKLRVFLRNKGKCQGTCGRNLYSQDEPECDHIIAIANGGQNKESNLQTLCGWCHAAKTRRDVALKSKTYKSRLRHYGLHKPKGRPMPGSRASGWKHKITGEWVRR